MIILIILYILIAVLGGVVTYASDREKSIFFNACIRLAGNFLLVFGVIFFLHALL